MPPPAPRSVSVVIPTYLRNRRLEQAIESALAQQHEPEEIIVVDGSGHAHARRVARRFDEVDYVAQDEDEGPQAARSLGAERASGELIQFLDDDDRLRPAKIRKQTALVSDEVGVVYCGVEDEAYGRILPDSQVRGDVLARALAMNTFPCIPSTMLIDADVLEELLPLRHRHAADDTGMKIELARRTRFDYVDEPLVVRGVTEQPLARSWAHIEARKRLVDTYADLYEAQAPDARRAALHGTFYREGVKRMETAAWSPRAIASFARAAWYAPRERLRYAGRALASLLGRPGLRLVDGGDR